VHEQVEKEALVQMLQQVVQTPEAALDDAADSHLVLPAIAKRLQGHGVDVVRDEAAMGSTRQAEALLQHSAQHGAQAVLVPIIMAPHLLQGNTHAHLTPGNIHDRVDQVQVRQLAVDSVVHDVHTFETVLLRIIDGDRALQQTGLERQARDAGGVVCIVVCIDPRLRAGNAVRSQQQDDVLGPQRPPLEVAHKRQGKRDALSVDFMLDIFPSGHQHDSFGCVASRCLEDGVEVLSRVGLSCSLVGEVLASCLETKAFDNGFESVVAPTLR
jgi:hypothetical protein